MSPEGIERRLREVGQLYRLGRAIRAAKKIDGPVDPAAGQAAKCDEHDDPAQG